MDIPDTVPPNGGGYTLTETRTGPPLSYVAGKLHDCLTRLHSLHSLVMRDIPNDLPCPGTIQPHFPQYDPKQCSVIGPCKIAFRYALISYLALNNLLAMGNEPGVVDKLLEVSGDDFKKWLDDVYREGSVT